jgi:hypothetical protein
MYKLTLEEARTDGHVHKQALSLGSFPARSPVGTFLFPSGQQGVVGQVRGLTIMYSDGTTREYRIEEV